MDCSIEPQRALGSPLQSCDIDVLITDLTAVHCVRYHFTNHETTNIEAVFTLPLPSDAAFIRLTAAFAGQEWALQISATDNAQRGYDRAVSDGHSAVLFRRVDEGLYTLAIGNIAAGETVAFTLEFARALELQDRAARFRLPLALRPRYGEWDLEPAETPVHSVTANYPVRASVRIEGLLATTAVSCASHRTRVTVTDGALLLHTVDAALDRDLVVGFDLGATPLAPQWQAWVEGDRVASELLWSLPSPTAPGSEPLHLITLLDCSGSMQGAAIAGCRQAMIAIADALDDPMTVQFVCFGSEVRPLLEKPSPAVPATRQALRSLATQLNADMGGTELATALDAALKDLEALHDDAANQAILLVTDGAIDPSSLVRATTRAKRRGVRVFVVAVGESATVEALAPFSTSTDGRLESVTPGEDIADAVMRQFSRIRQRRPALLEVEFPPGAEQVGETSHTYLGDTVRIRAWLPSAEAAYRLHLRESPDATAQTYQGSVISRANTPYLRALWGQGLVNAARGAKAKTSLALDYGLITQYTAGILVKERGEGAFAALPGVRRVSHMHVPSALSVSMCAIPAFMRRLPNDLLCPVFEEPEYPPAEIQSDEDAAALQAQLAELIQQVEAAFQPKFSDLKPIQDWLRACLDADELPTTTGAQAHVSEAMLDALSTASPSFARERRAQSDQWLWELLVVLFDVIADELQDEHQQRLGEWIARRDIDVDNTRHLATYLAGEDRSGDRE